MKTLHKTLCLDARSFSKINDESVDLIVTSPPYPMIQMWDDLFTILNDGILPLLQDAQGYKAFEAMHQVLDQVWQECFRVLQDGAFMCINIGDATRSLAGNFALYPNHSRIAMACIQLGFTQLPTLLWRKTTNAPNKFMGSGVLPSGAYVTLEHEYILVFRKGAKKSPKGDWAERRSTSAIFWEERNIWFSDIWNLKGQRQSFEKGAGASTKTRDRSAAFPFELPWRLIHMYSCQGDTVLDPFMGSGTTRLAALACARNSIGIDIDTELATNIELPSVSACAELNHWARQRLESHKNFLSERQNLGKEALHKNENYNCPVIMKQEEKILIPVVSSVESSSSNSFTANHDTLIINDLFSEDELCQ